LESDVGGNYLLEVRPREPNAAGVYTMWFHKLVERTEENRHYIVADQKTGEGLRLHEIGTEAALREAIPTLTEAIPHWRAAGDPTQEFETHMYLGEVHYNLGEYQEALDLYDRAFALLPSMPVEGRGDAWVYNNFGATYKRLGDFQKALDFLTLSLRDAEQAPGRVGRKYYRPIGIAMTNVGLLHATLGEMDNAIEYLRGSIPHWRSEEDKEGEARALYGLGTVYARMGNHENASENYQQALRYWQATGDLRGQARVLNGLARLRILSGRFNEALGYLTTALHVEHTAGDQLNKTTTLLYTGQAQYALGDRIAAMDYYEEALKLCSTTRDLETEADAFYYLARAYSDRGDLAKAREAIEQSLQNVEELRMSIAGQDVRATYFATVREFYDFYIDLLMRMHRQDPSSNFDRQALQVSEQSRARSLVETLTEARADIRQGVDINLVESERTLQRRLNARAAYRDDLVAKGRDAVEVGKELEQIVSDLRRVWAQLKSASPRYAALTQPQSLKVTEIQQQVLDANTMLLEYALGETTSYLWAVSDNAITTFELPGRALIEAEARQVYNLLTARSRRLNGETAQQRRLRIAAAERECAGAMLRLSRMILGPVGTLLGKKRLLVVADGALQYIPFAALPVPATGNRPLIADHEIVNLPSASTLAVLRREFAGRHVAPRTVAVLADPVFSADDPRVRRTPALKRKLNESAQATLGVFRDLRRALRDVSGEDLSAGLPRLYATRFEAHQLEKLAKPAERLIVLDFNASRETATSGQLGDYRIVHFASHALVDTKHPELSGIVLSLVDEQGQPRDGFLRLHEIYNLKLPAELVVLNACRTGLGKEVRGEGLIGLTRGFMYAGAARVLVSLWSIDDRASAELMTRMYAKMLGRERMSPSAALRAAQIELWKKGSASAYYWAGFSLQGEWK
jgi:CHAT domain-containing protein/Tfp pilus assembly protein PilF